MAGYVIFAPAALDEGAQATAAAFGPSEVCADALPDVLARSVGFSVLEYTDVTDEFYRTSRAFNEGLTALQSALRAAEGDEAFEEDRDRKASMLEGIERNLLRRCLIVAMNE